MGRRCSRCSWTSPRASSSRSPQRTTTTDGEPCAHSFLAAALGRLLLELFCDGECLDGAQPAQQIRRAGAQGRASRPAAWRSLKPPGSPRRPARPYRSAGADPRDHRSLVSGPTAAAPERTDHARPSRSQGMPGS
jgi:hypothetical protein